MIIAVDFDVTLSRAPYPGCGNPNTELFQRLISAQSNGDKVILFTCRHDKELDEAVSFCEAQGLVFDKVNENLPELIEKYGDTRKIFADVYIDENAKTPISFLTSRVCL